MFFLKSDKHLEAVSKELYNDKYFSDIVFIVKNKSFYGHSSLILQHIDSLGDLLCGFCKDGHEQMVIFLPGVDEHFIETALAEFFLRGDPDKLRSILNAKSVKTERIHGEVLKDTCKYPMDMYKDGESMSVKEIKTEGTGKSQTDLELLIHDNFIETNEIDSDKDMIEIPIENDSDSIGLVSELEEPETTEPEFEMIEPRTSMDSYNEYSSRSNEF